MLTLREMMVELILFAFDEEDLQAHFHVTTDEVAELSDVDLLELYDQTFIMMAED